MYNEFYGFSEAPFSATPDPRFLYTTPDHRDAVASILNGLIEQKGFVTVTGDVGTGKTILIHALLQQLPDRVKTVFIFFHTLVTFEQLLKTILRELGLPGAAREKKVLLRELGEYLAGGLSPKEALVVIIDEAQNLSREILEEFEDLLGLETPAARLMQVVFVGQTELETKLGRGGLRQLKERIVVRHRVRPLSPEESLHYIEHRLALAGSSRGPLFAPGALSLIRDHAEGIPRAINILCDNALMIGFATRRKTIDAATVRQAIADLDGSPTTLRSAGGLSRVEEAPASVLEEAVRPVSDIPPAPRPGPAADDVKTPRPFSRASMFFFLAAAIVLCLGLLVFLGKEAFREGPPSPGKVQVPQGSPGSAAKPSPPAPAPAVGETPPPEKAPVLQASPGGAAKPSPPAPVATVPAAGETIPLKGPPSGPLEKKESAPPAGSGGSVQITVVREKDNLSTLVRKRYGEAGETVIDLVLESNPDITNIHLIRIDQALKFPRLSEESLIAGSPGKGFRIHAGTFAASGTAKGLRKEAVLSGKELEILPRQVSPTETWYRVMAGPFASREECLNVISALREKGFLPRFRRQ
jgi:type II secretory pathway predicted ATPase ExeA